MQRSDVLTGLSIRLGPALKIYERHVKVLQRTHFLEDEDLWGSRLTGGARLKRRHRCIEPTGTSSWICDPPPISTHMKEVCGERRPWWNSLWLWERQITIRQSSYLSLWSLRNDFHFTHLVIQLHRQGNWLLCCGFVLKWTRVDIPARGRGGGLQPEKGTQLCTKWTTSGSMDPQRDDCIYGVAAVQPYAHVKSVGLVTAWKVKFLPSSWYGTGTLFFSFLFFSESVSKSHK